MNSETALPRYAATCAGRFSRRDALRFAGTAGAAALVLPLLRAPLHADEPAPAAPSIAGAQPGFYRFHIGEHEALALSDGSLTAPLGGVWTGGTTEKIAADLEAAAMPLSQVDLPFAVLLVRMGSELVLVDAGSGTLFGPAAGKLPESLAAAGVQQDQITAIVLTHAHGDHFGGLLDSQTKAPAFPNARLFIHRREYDYWTSDNPDASEMVIPPERRARLFPTARQYLKAFEGKWHFVAPGEQILPGLEIVDAAGHTPGQIGLLFSSGRERLLHLADAVHHHAVSFANPEWIYNFDSLPKLAVETRRRLLDRAAAERLRLFGSHLSFPGLGRVRKVGEHYEHIIEPWIS